MTLASYSMKTRMSFPILAGAALILLVLAYVINVRTGRNLEESTYSKGQNFSNFLQKVSLPYLNNFDLSALEGFATEATKDSEVAFIVFYDDKKKALTEGSKEPADTTPYVIFEKQISRDDGKLMGYLKIGYKRDNLVEAQRRNSFVCLAAILFALLLVAAIVYWVAHRFDGVLSSVIDQMSTASTKLTNLGSQLSETSEASSQSTAESAASLEETSASLQQLSLTVKSNADKSKEAADLSQSSRATVQEGKGEINKLAGAMSEISESSKRIAEIIDVIEDIAFQTNLLALNAAVEAARAGEHGKGFAVVAEAVRSLAQRTSSASKDIALLIRDSSAKTGHGVEVVKRSGEVLENIVKSVMKVSELNLEIAKASQEQANGIRHINNAMGQLDTITQRNATNADQVSQSSVEMMTQSTVLLELVDKMVVLTKGQAFAHRLTTEREDEAPFAPDSGHRHAPAHGTRRRMPAGYHAPSVADVIPLPRPGSSRAVEHEHGDDDVVVEAGPADDSGRKQA